jgi:hypothetical protein
LREQSEIDGVKVIDMTFGSWHFYLKICI